MFRFYMDWWVGVLFYLAGHATAVIVIAKGKKK